jgi:hypothetical protein
VPRVNDLLRERYPEVLAEQQRAFRWLQSAKRNRFKVARATEAYKAATLARLQAENVIRRELHLPIIPERVDTKAPR